MFVTNKEIHHYWLTGHSLRNKGCLPAVSVVETPALLPGWNFVTNLASLSQQGGPNGISPDIFSMFCSKLLHCPLGTSPVPCFQSNHLFNKYMSWRQISQNYQNVTQVCFEGTIIVFGRKFSTFFWRRRTWSPVLVTFGLLWDSPAESCKSRTSLWKESFMYMCCFEFHVKTGSR